MRSNEFDMFYASLSHKVQQKIDYAVNVIANIKVVNNKLVKKLVNTDFYELRISVGDEYRVIIFTVDNESFIEANTIFLLNGFMKKSTKDYKKEIERACEIIKRFEI